MRIFILVFILTLKTCYHETANKIEVYTEIEFEPRTTGNDWSV